MRTLLELIELKRDGGAHTDGELKRLVDAFVAGEMPDYQMSAWLMAAFLNGLSSEETAALTSAMTASGRVVDLSDVPGIKVDKHSTGGVGDTTTMVLAPLVASCGVPVAKMSGRGLGHTGGTLDKLESIPGFSVSLDPARFVEQVKEIGVAVIAQSADVDPADKKMYALRDVTGTVPSIPLIVSSIISKKIAGGADAMVLDVKVGSGSFMKTESDARELAAELTRVGELMGRTVVCVMTDMDQPLGRAVGNALEVREAIDTLRGEGPADLTELCLCLGSKMLVLGGVAVDQVEARTALLTSIASGRAIETFRAWVSAQGGNALVTDDPSLLPVAPVTHAVLAQNDGYVAGFDAESVGRAAMALGAGRARQEDDIDLGAGLVMAHRVGDRVMKGDTIATLYTSDAGRLEEAEQRFVGAFRLSDEPVQALALFHEV
ncbi:MAG: thymidine phosphorylase [Coriobacteriia bacterium]|nr:thymidine phosphorylase [Coriobacteriia bacterium]